MKIRDIIRPLLQEIYQDDPWKMLVCCILLNLTKRQQVDGIRHELFSKYPTEYEMMEADAFVAEDEPQAVVHFECIDVSRYAGRP